MRPFVLFTILIAFLPGSSSARTWHILPDGTGDAPTIQAGIDSTVHHDTVLVAPGTYREVINFLGKKIAVGSYFLTTQDTTYISQTVIDGYQLYWSVVLFNHDEEPSALLEGLTLIRGFGTWQGYIYGGGICCIDTSPTIRNMIIRECMTTASNEFGGGICVLGGSPLIEGVRLEENFAHEGGGIQCEGSNAHPTIRNSVITGNTAKWGSGVGLYAGASALLENVIIAGNIRHPNGPGYGIHCGSGCRLIGINATMADNQGGGILLSNGGNAVFANSILWGDDAPEISFLPGYDPCSVALSHCDISGGLDGIETNDNGTVYWLTGNMDEDPLFWNPGNGNYDLLPDSPCIDAGTDFFEWEEVILIDLDPEEYCGEAPDMGALEYCIAPGDVTEVRSHLTQPIRAHPNPFHPGTKIDFSLDRAEQAEIAVYDVTGRLVAILADRGYRPGSHSVQWDGTDAAGRSLPSGTYLVRMKRSGRSTSCKALLAR